jgi:hypothetical protein
MVSFPIDTDLSSCSIDHRRVGKAYAISDVIALSYFYPLGMIVLWPTSSTDTDILRT